MVTQTISVKESIKKSVLPEIVWVNYAQQLFSSDKKEGNYIQLRRKFFGGSYEKCKKCIWRDIYLVDFHAS